MARKSSTQYLRNPPGPRDDRGFNPFQETQKIIGFVEQACRLGSPTFTVIVKDGVLQWTGKRLGKDHPGFIVVVDVTKFAVGLTSKEWRILEYTIAMEMTEQRKAW